MKSFIRIFILLSILLFSIPSQDADVVSVGTYYVSTSSDASDFYYYLGNTFNTMDESDPSKVPGGAISNLGSVSLSDNWYPIQSTTRVDGSSSSAGQNDLTAKTYIRWGYRSDTLGSWEKIGESIHDGGAGGTYSQSLEKQVFILSGWQYRFVQFKLQVEDTNDSGLDSSESNIVLLGNVTATPTFTPTSTPTPAATPTNTPAASNLSVSQQTEIYNDSNATLRQISESDQGDIEFSTYFVKQSPQRTAATADTNDGDYYFLHTSAKFAYYLATTQNLNIYCYWTHGNTSSVWKLGQQSISLSGTGSREVGLRVRIPRTLAGITYDGKFTSFRWYVTANAGLMADAGWSGTWLQPAVTPSPTNTPSPTPTSTALPTGTPTPIPTNTNTPTRTNTPTNTPTKTSTPTGVWTPAPTSTPTNTPVQPTSTNTPTVNYTATPTWTNLPNTPTGTYVPTNTPTKTQVPSTPTNTYTATNTPIYTPTNTPTWTSTPTVNPTATPTTPSGVVFTIQNFLNNSNPTYIVIGDPFCLSNWVERRTYPEDYPNEDAPFAHYFYIVRQNMDYTYTKIWQSSTQDSQLKPGQMRYFPDLGASWFHSTDIDLSVTSNRGYLLYSYAWALTGGSASQDYVEIRFVTPTPTYTPTVTPTFTATPTPTAFAKIVYVAPNGEKRKIPLIEAARQDPAATYYGSWWYGGIEMKAKVIEGTNPDVTSDVFWDGTKWWYYYSQPYFGD